MYNITICFIFLLIVLKYSAYLAYRDYLIENTLGLNMPTRISDEVIEIISSDDEVDTSTFASAISEETRVTREICVVRPYTTPTRDTTYKSTDKTESNTDRFK